MAITSSAGARGLYLGVINAVLILLLGYAFMTARSTVNDRFATMESAAQRAQQTQSETDKKITNLASDFEQINKRVGVTHDELAQARQTAQFMKRQQE